MTKKEVLEMLDDMDLQRNPFRKTRLLLPQSTYPSSRYRMPCTNTESSRWLFPSSFTENDDERGNEENDERWRDREQCGMYNRKDHAGSQLQP